MLELRTHRITLHLRCYDADPATPGTPVDGEVRCEDGSVRPFTGWLGLVNELERVVGAGTQGDPA